MSPVHHVYPRFPCRLAVTDRCAGAPAPSGLPGARDPRRFLARAAAVVLAVAALTSVGCSDIEPAEASDDRSLRFEGSAATLDLLGEAVLEGLTRGDTLSLGRFRLTEREHNEVVWPELPASAPEVNFPVDFAWQNVEGRNLRALRRVLPVYSDREMSFRSVECRGETQRFQTFVVLTDCWVLFDWEGEPYEAQLFKDVLSRGGGLKVFRYYEEEPRRHRGGSGR